MTGAVAAPPAVRLIVLDLDDTLDPVSLAAFLPAGRMQLAPLLASAFGAPRVVRQGNGKSPVDWDGVSAAIVSLVEEARNSTGGREVEHFVAGRAPLPVFAHLGFEFSAFTFPPTVLNRRKDGTWDVISLAATDRGSGTRFFGPAKGLPDAPAEATGRVAVFVSTIGDPAPKVEIRRFVQARGDELAGFVELMTPGPGLLTRENAGVASMELAECLSRVPGCFPHCSGLALFIAGPAHLALMAGRAVNAHMVRDLWIPNFDATTYVPAVTLPWRSAAVILDQSDEAVAARQRVLDELRHGIGELQESLEADALRPILSSSEAEAVLTRLRSLKPAATPEGSAFALHFLEDHLSFGDGLLDALRGEPKDVLKRAAGLFVVHEVYHVGQGLLSTNFAGIGRAGVALEEIDYWADAVAVGALAKNAVARSATPSSAAVQHIEAAIRCMEAFDRAEQGLPIKRLPERRLRRYLIWHLQLARARTVRSAESIDELFADRVVVELAPLHGSLDARDDKIVQGVPGDCSMSVVVRRKLTRYYPNPHLAPTLLVEAVRCFDWKVLGDAMDHVVNEKPGLMAPWRVSI
jgi:hypothetical protein